MIGAGPNGLVAANLLVDAGWSVVVLEAHAEPGGAVRSSELVAPGFVHDWASSFYPLGAASPVLRALDLEAHGLVWRRAPVALAHPTPDGCAYIEPGALDATERSLDAYAPGDGVEWRRLYRRWERMGPAFLDALMAPFPPVRDALRVARVAGLQLPWLIRYLLISAGRAAKTFDGEGGGLLLAGNTMHTDLALSSATGALFGWLLASLGQQVGFPVPEGGAGRLTQALVQRFTERGGELRCGEPVTGVDVEHGRAVGVRVGDSSVSARRGVIADVSAPALYRELLDERHVPWRVRFGLRRFRWDYATVKVDWAVDGTVPWTAEPARRAGTVHLADSLADIETYARQVGAGAVPARPFVIVGQTTTSDATRSPAGTEALWAYAHMPQQIRDGGGTGIRGEWDDADAQRAADLLEGEVERRAPGFRALIRARRVLTPRMFEHFDANLVGGAVNGGTARIRQQLFLRPVPGVRAGARTPVRGLYLASAAAHPGGGVHGACGANAAHFALHDARQ